MNKLSDEDAEDEGDDGDDFPSKLELSTSSRSKLSMCTLVTQLLTYPQWGHVYYPSDNEIYVPSHVFLSIISGN